MAELEEAQRDPEQVESIADEQRWGTRELEITAIELCGRNGQPRTTFMTGEPLTIRLHYRCSEEIERPVFGFGIIHQNGLNIFGPNTKLAALNIDHLDKGASGVVSYEIPELPLLEGQYSLSVAAVNDADTITYDYHDRAYPFRVAYSPLRAGYGMVQLRGEWRIDTAPHADNFGTEDEAHSHWTKA
jgi:lipopolysaccharide transport system ATP-binding protein